MTATDPLIAKLAEIVGATHVSSAPTDIDAFAGLAPFAVAWPGSPPEVAGVLKSCRDSGVAVAVAGRGTRLARHWPVPNGRPCVALDTRRMTNILDVDELSLTVLSQTGIMVRHLEEALNRQRLTLGPYPVEIQSSTLGGVLAAPPPTAHSPLTGYLADACLALSVAHADGSAVQTRLAPRRATGPDIARLYLGSRGGLGVITTAVMRVHRLFEEVQALVFAFPGLLEAVTGIREVMARGVRPARVRLLGAGLAAQEIGETGVALQAACLVVLGGPASLVHRQHCLVDELLGRVGAMELSQAVASRWWQQRSTPVDQPAARLAVVGARLRYSQLPEALGALPELLRRHHATVWLEEFDQHGANLWLASRRAESRKEALAAGLLDLGVDPIRPSFPPLMEELRAALDPSGTLVVMEN